jgi:twinkle protein
MEDGGVLDESGKKIQITRKDVMPNITTPMDYIDALVDLYNKGGPQKGASTGWPNVDEFYTVEPGQWTLITGLPGHGKSEWLDNLMLNLAARKDWRFAVYSPENFPKEVHIAKLLSKRIGKPFRTGPTERINHTELAEHVGFLEGHFGFLKAQNDEPMGIDQILDECWVWVQLDPGHPCAIVIDPWNELDHLRPNDRTETEYISRALSTIRRFARNHKCHVFIVAHPRIMHREKDGKIPVPTPYDVAGSAHWFNKADNCIAVWRDTTGEANRVSVLVQKVRFSHIGRVGSAELIYDRVTGQFRTPLGLAAERYRNASEGE